MYTLYKENIQEIIQYLKPKDCYHFALSCKIYHNNFNIKQNLINEMNQRLLCIFGDKLDNFKNIFQQYGCFISGSFIIQCLLDEHWPNSDIDIYVPLIGNLVYYPDDMHMKTDVDNFMFYTMGFDGYYDGREVGEYRKNGTKLNDCLQYVRNYESKYYNVQIIGLEIGKSVNDIKDFVNKTFDFPICKNIYYYDRKEYVLLHNLDNIFKKETLFQTGKLMSLSIKRYHKYKNNGILFTNKNDLTYNDIITTRDNYYNNDLSTKHRGYVYNNIYKATDLDYDKIASFFGPNIKYKKRTRTREQYNCILEECLIHFVDDKVKHLHMGNYIELI